MSGGHTLVGDATYGGILRQQRCATPELADALRGFKRQALHAEKLEFAHPADGRLISVEAERPGDMEVLLAALREDVKASE
mgnify:CR=1 FL=1